MQIHDLKSPQGARKRKRIVGRGRGSGRGKTSGRGQTGQGQRAGRGMLASLESGHVPLIRRLPKVGFHSHRPVLYQLVKLEQLSKFKEGALVNALTLKSKGLIKNIYKPFKVLGTGDIKKALTVEAYAFSKSAAEKIKKAGGETKTVNQKDIKKSNEEALKKK